MGIFSKFISKKNKNNVDMENLPGTHLVKISDCDTELKKVDVIFVHGLGGQSVETWKGSNGFYWPQELGKELKDSRIWSLEYNASPINHTLSLPDLATNIIAGFENFDIGALPIIFICHSLGGLVVKQLLRNCSDRHDGAHRIFDNTKGIVFLATPHAGAQWARRLSKIPLFKGSLLFRALELDDPHLYNLNLWFQNNFQGVVSVYFETLPIKGVLVVDANSSNPGMSGVVPIPMEKDHIEICKPASNDDDIYMHTRRFIESSLSKQLDPALKEKWKKWIDTYLQDLNEELNDRDSGVEIPLIYYWNRFLATDVWHEPIRNLFNKVAAFTPKSQLEASINSLSKDLQYKELVKECPPLVSSAIDTLLEKLDGLKDGEFEKCKSLISELRQLQKVFHTPRFSRGFFITGASGEGKTYFLKNLIKNNSEGNWILPVIKSDTSNSLKTTLLKSINNLTETQWSSLESFFEFFSRTYPEQRIFVIIDNFHEWLEINLGNKNELKDLIEKNANESNLIYWIVSIHDSRYNLVTLPNNFYINYSSSFVDNGHYSIGGWISVNDLNLRNKTGFNILMESPTINETNQNTVKNVGENEQHYSNPFVAWIARELCEEGKILNLNDVRYVEYIQRFWEQRKERLEAMFTSQFDHSLIGLLDDGVLFTGDYFSRMNMSGNYTSLIDEIVKSAEGQSEICNRSKAQNIIDILIKGSLISKRKMTIGYEVGVLFNVFWEYYIANYFFNKYGYSTDIFLILKERLIKTGNTLSNGILQFLFLIIDKHIQESENPESLETLISPLLGDNQLMEQCCLALALAGTKSSDAFKHSIADLLCYEIDETVISNHVYAYMYFFQHCPNNLVSLENRLKLLKPHFLSIRKKSLSQFFEYFISKSVRDISNNVILIDALPFFSGCEVLDVSGEDELKITQSLAMLIVEKLLINGPRNEQLEKLFNIVVRHISSHSKKYNREIGDSKRNSSWYRKYFIEWFLCAYCRKIVDTYGIFAFRLFEKCGWYTKNLGSITERMEREANRAFGYWFRHKVPTPEQRSEYFKVVKQLAETNSPIKIRISFFLIYDTIVEKDDVVSADFYPILRIIHSKLGHHNDLKSLKFNYNEFFTKYLINTPKS